MDNFAGKETRILCGLRAASVLPLLLSLFFLLGLPVLCANDLDQIESHITSGVASKEDVEVLNEYCRKNQYNPRPHVLLGKLYSSYNFGEMASAEFEAAIKLDRNQPEVWILLINEKYRHRKSTDADKLLKQAETLFPKNPRVLLVKGVFLFRQKQFVEAEKYLSRAHSLRANDPEILVAQSKVFHELHRFEDALRVAQQALKLKPDFGEAYRAAGEALWKLDRDQEAISALTTGFSYAPFDRGLVTSLVALAYMRGEYLLALEAALAKMGLDVNSDERLGRDKDDVIDLIDLCVKKGIRDEQIMGVINNTANKLRGTGHEGKYFFCLGDIYDGFGQHDRGMTFYREGLKIEPTYARAWLRLGEDLELVGKLDEAYSCYTKAYSLKKQDPEIVDRLARLEARLQNDLAWRLRKIIQNTFIVP